MAYKFKHIKPTKAEKLWLTEILNADFSKVDVKSLKVKLWNKLPKDFDPESIDNRLIRNNHLTLIGLWHVDPQSPIFSHVSKIMETMKDLILKNPNIKQIKSNEIADIVGITEKESQIALRLIYDLGGFFGSASGSISFYGFREVSFSQNDSAYDEFLKFKNLERKMEQFFVSQASFSKNKNKKLSKGKSTPNSNTFCKRPSSMYTWNDIQNDYDVSKQTFAKRINFVTDRHKRKIIFRDIEDAYVLSKKGFYKPAIILAGSVIEELLRLYLVSQNVKPKNNNFDEYVKTCEREKLLESGISRLSDSVRYFRNLVHLSKESTKKHSITKAAAKGAVSSIFTIANDF